MADYRVEIRRPAARELDKFGSNREQATMPIYTYECPACQEQFDLRRSFTDETLVACPKCGGQARRVLAMPNLNTWKAKIVPPR